MKHTFVTTLIVAFALTACVSTFFESGEDSSDNGPDIFNSQQRLIADQLISIFENNTPIIQYGYAENLDDGRGITAGRAGFTSATGDMLEVISRYTELVPDNPLATYLTRLEELAETEDDSTAGLEGLEALWTQAADDQQFKDVQDEVVDEYYFDPATVWAATLGATYPLTLMNLYDAIIQHGEGDDPDGLPAMIERATQNVGGSPNDGIDESLWLEEFMSIRRSVLLNPDNEETQAEWSESVGRVDALKSLYDGGNLDLSPPVVVNPWGDEFTLSGE